MPTQVLCVLARAAVAAIGVTAALAAAAPPAHAFDLDGHSVIEAAAYKRLLALAEVPETGVSGRVVLAELVAGGVLLEPPCFDGRNARGGCGPEDRRRRPLAYWPLLRSGTADLIVDRQLSARAQCQHFMAETADGLSPPDPRTGVPRDLERAAYARCVTGLGVAFDGILRDPRLARGRLVGMYALIHAVEDSFSAAHASRDADGRIEYLLSWKLVDWPTYLERGLHSFPPETHHAVKDRRDEDYLRADAFAEDGRRCATIANPYAVPEACLTPRAHAATDAVVDLLILTYRLRVRARAQDRLPSLASEDDLRLWRRYLARHFASAFEPPPDPLPGQSVGFARTDVFLGVRGSVGRSGERGASLWSSRLFYGPAVPFALLLSGGVGLDRTSGTDAFVGALGLGLALPLVRRFTIGFVPIGLAVGCDTRFTHCSSTSYATLGVVVIPLPWSLWLGLEGPRWDWKERSLRASVFALSLGWSHEEGREEPDLDQATVRSWDPPTPGEVLAYRGSAVTWLISFAATAGSTPRDRWVGGQFDVRWDRDRWNRRAGVGPALSLSAARGTIDSAPGSEIGFGASLVGYVLPNRLAVVGTPASIRIEARDGHSASVDVSGLLSLVFDLTRVEVAVDSPPLSYVSRSRWHELPLVVRLGLLLD